jgi:hypothetical protein
MENQHRQIKGYRDLSQEEIDLMNKVKEAGKEISVLVETIYADKNTDHRWVAIAKTDLQKGFMALTRSVAKPTTF